MPAIPSCRPDGPKIRALINGRGYSMAGFARKIGRPQSSGTIRNICAGYDERCSVTIIRQIAQGLSTRTKPVRPGDISDWTADDDTWGEPEIKIAI